MCAVITSVPIKLLAWGPCQGFIKTFVMDIKIMHSFFFFFQKKYHVDFTLKCSVWTHAWMLAKTLYAPRRDYRAPICFVVISEYILNAASGGQIASPVHAGHSFFAICDHSLRSGDFTLVGSLTTRCHSYTPKSLMQTFSLRYCRYVLRCYQQKSNFSTIL